MMGDLVPVAERRLGPVAIGAADIDLAEFGERSQHRVDPGMAGIVCIDQQGNVLECLVCHAR